MLMRHDGFGLEPVSCFNDLIPATVSLQGVGGVAKDGHH